MNNTRACSSVSKQEVKHNTPQYPFSTGEQTNTRHWPGCNTTSTETSDPRLTLCGAFRVKASDITEVGTSAGECAVTCSSRVDCPVGIPPLPLSQVQ